MWEKISERFAEDNGTWGILNNFQYNSFMMSFYFRLNFSLPQTTLIRVNIFH